MSSETLENHYSKEIIDLPDTIIVTLCWSGNHNSKTFSYYLDAFETTVKLLKNNSKVKLYLPEIEEKLNTILELYKLYKPELYNLVLENIITPDKKFKFIRPPHIKAKTIIFIDGCLPSKGYMECDTLILLLVSNNFWWAKNIKLFNIQQLRSVEIYYDSHIGMVNDPTTKIKQTDLQKLGEEFYKEFHKVFQKVFQKVFNKSENELKPNHPNHHNHHNHVNIKYLNGYKRNINFGLYNPIIRSDYQNPKFMLYVYGENRNLFHLQNIYKKDMYKVLKSIIHSSIKNPKIDSFKNIKPTQCNISILGWEPLYSIQDKVYYNSNPTNKKEKITTTRKQACVFAGDFEEYLNIGIDTLIDVEIIPKSDLPIENILDFDYYIYLPALQLNSDKVISTEITSRLLQECIFYNKHVIIPDFILYHLKYNESIMQLICTLTKKKLLTIFQYEE